MGGAAVGTDPAATADAARRHRPVAQRQLVDGAAAEGVVDQHPALLSGAAADADVATAIDRVGPVLAKLRGDEVGDRPLAMPPLSILTPGGRITVAVRLVNSDRAPER